MSRMTDQPSSSSMVLPETRARPSSPPLMYPPTPPIDPTPISEIPPLPDFSPSPRVCQGSSVDGTGTSTRNLDDVVKGKDAAASESDSTLHSYELDEVVGLPWVSFVSDQTDVYIPPVIHRLIDAMKRELEAETRARYRAESMYNEELRKRVALEQRLEQLEAARQE
ncbi:hypothetical protein CONPUDRAFT_161308 [Coniophora puteana RWD-64-598 SS2]|uniref:Uncharacterized protein n=1 Tax=Coniophora puteana (strain RWD-64-598) TaxID=741705 RepID=A0A5M3N6W5_CONPW|nr:uncharacterized protein CONPUDRAFT_161308 [Coniophora puteana RWD-64-598 SS2]EIW86585.1 hypothetical protein CONPUDRAFT_161308 [Coniophora puteana RWD-64-598 SS2]